jgi:hypothetical protein
MMPQVSTDEQWEMWTQHCRGASLRALQREHHRPYRTVQRAIARCADAVSRVKGEPEVLGAAIGRHEAVYREAWAEYERCKPGSNARIGCLRVAMDAAQKMAELLGVAEIRINVSEEVRMTFADFGLGKRLAELRGSRLPTGDEQQPAGFA